MRAKTIPNKPNKTPRQAGGQFSTPLNEQGKLSDFTPKELNEFRAELAKRAGAIKQRILAAKKDLLDI